jgi:hypothetical protein
MYKTEQHRIKNRHGNAVVEKEGQMSDQETVSEPKQVKNVSFIHDDNDDDGGQLLFEMQFHNTVSLVKIKLFLIPQFRKPLT